MFIFTTDLDNTMIYSAGRRGSGGICVERRGEQALSYMDKDEYEQLQALSQKVTVIPCTTRSLEQYRRVEFLKSPPTLALVSNGGILLVDGQEDEQWGKETTQLIGECAEEIQKAAHFLGRTPEICFDIRNIDGLFLFTKSTDPQLTLRQLKDFLNMDQLAVEIGFNKVYVLPKVLHKGLAVDRIKKRLEGRAVLAAGDSVFDLPMLQSADIAIGIKEEHGEKLPQAQKNRFLFDGQVEQFCQFVLDTVGKIVG